MTNQNNKTPALRKETFICPHCNDSTQQAWESWKQHDRNYQHYFSEELRLLTAECVICLNYSIWLGNRMIYPIQSLAPKPAINMPDNVLKIYEEARLVSIHSPRAAAVLLRVAAEMLTAHLGEPEGKLYDRIRNLAKKKYLDERAINSFDIVRYKANTGGAHDNIINHIISAEEINKLFFSINYIVNEMINKPNEIDSIYGEIPQNNREQIAKDDNPKDKK